MEIIAKTLQVLHINWNTWIVLYFYFLLNLCLNSAWWDQFLPDLVCWAEEEVEGELQGGAGELQTSGLGGFASMSKVDNSENNKIKKMF